MYQERFRRIGNPNQLAGALIALLAVAMLLAACVQPPGAAPSTTASPTATPATPVAATASPQAAPEATPAGTPQPPLIRTPVAPPTATPTPLSTPETETAARLSDEGRKLFDKSDLAGAEAAYIQAIAADPAYVPAHLGLTEVYLYWPQYWQQALAEAETTVALAPNDGTALAYLAWAQQGAHRFDDAWDTILKAVELEPDNALVHTAAGDVLSSVYQMDEALEHARRAVELDSELADAWATLGSVLASLHYWDEATAAYDRAIELEPDFFVWRLARAQHELNITGDAAAARDLASLAFEVQPAHPWTIYLAVDLAIAERDWDGAESRCQELVKYDQPQTPFPDAYTCFVSIFILQERFDEAETYQALAEEAAWPDRFDVTAYRMRLYNEREECDKSRELAQRWLDARPYSVAAVRMLGVSDLCAEDFERAADYFQQALEKLPRSVDDARLLAVAYARDDRKSDALQALQKVASFARDDPMYYQALYEVHIIQGQSKDALDAAQRWQVLRPDDTEPLVDIALSQLFLGNLSAARASAEKAVDMGDTSSLNYAVLGESLRQMGETEEAEKYLKLAVERNSQNYLAHNFIAALYLQQGRCEDALPHLEWILDHTDDEEQKATVSRAIDSCQQQVASAQATPEPEGALDDDAAVEAAVAVLVAAGVEPRNIEMTEVSGQWSLAVAFSTTTDPKSDEFLALERKLGFALARLLPRIESAPTLLVLIAAADDSVQSVTLIPADAAKLWVQGQLTDDEFHDTWDRRSMDDSGG